MSALANHAWVRERLADGYTIAAQEMEVDGHWCEVGVLRGGSHILVVCALNYDDLHHAEQPQLRTLYVGHPAEGRSA